ncbi:Synthetically lethal with a defective Min system protein A [Kluyvera cryocrescens]|uniref:Synthetically lethal with a defective Min system protein A n=1 Tax=Kluyvera cryocrescens TaxID=580 RepID=A0A485AIM9_KLUCR|nr:Synthetically lethal with a defective Min system protein A [Kluyvera cryocrescens]
MVANVSTTAKLAASVGVSEAALYRHFPSKTRMFDSLIEFIEDSLINPYQSDFKG